MAFDDLLLHLDTYPDASPTSAIDDAVAFARAVGGKITALALQAEIPLESNRLADYLLGLSGMIEGEEARSLQACRAGLSAFTTAAEAAGVFGGVLQGRADILSLASHVARHARTRDLCLVPIANRFDGQQEVAQAAIFESGRPVLIYSAGTSVFRGGLKRIAIAWDGGPCAASAVGAAMPLLGAADEVRILTVVDEKPAAVGGLTTELARHLEAHGIDARGDEIPAAGRRIDAALDAYLADTRPDLLVMGAYGHSRLREFILGGATEHMLWNCPVPTLLSR